MAQTQCRIFDDAAFERYRSTLFFANTLSLSRIARLLGSGLAAGGYYGKGAKVGVVSVDLPEYRRAIEQEYIPQLAGLGAQLVDKVYTNPFDLGVKSSEVANAILRFRNNGVTHVVFLEPQGELFAVWTHAAEQQRYRPRYGISSGEFAGGLKDLYPPGQLPGTVGVAWVPMYDANQAGDPGPTPRQAECNDIMNKAGQPPADRVQQGRAAVVCDFYFFLKLVLDRATDLSPAALQGVVESLGAAFRPALTFAGRHDSSRHDGAGLYGTTRYDTRCTCFAFFGERRPVP